MKKVYFAIGYQPVENFIMNQMKGKIEVVGNAVYRESILPAILEKEPDILITRETLPGSTDFLEIVDRIRVECSKDVQIIFITGGRQPGDAFLSALIRYGVYDIVVGDNIKMMDVCRMIETPNKYRDVFMYSPKVKVDEKTKKEIFEAPTTPKVIEKIVEREVIIDNTTVQDAYSSRMSLDELEKIKEQKYQIEKEQENLLKMKKLLEDEKLALEHDKVKMNEDYERRKLEFEEEMALKLRSIENDRDKLIREEEEKLRLKMEAGRLEIERLKEEANNTLNKELKQIHLLKQQEVEDKIRVLEEENESKIKALKDEALQKSMEEQERYNQMRLDEIEKFQEDKIKLEKKYDALKEEQNRQNQLREEQERQMKYQMELLSEEKRKIQEQRENDLKIIDEAKRQLEQDRMKFQEESELRMKEEKEALELLLKEQEFKLSKEKNQLMDDYKALNNDIANKLEIEKQKIQRDANDKFNKYKEELKQSMMKKLEEEREKMLSDSKQNKSTLDEHIKKEQARLQKEYKIELEEKLQTLKDETNSKLKLEQDRLELYRKEEELKLKRKKNELEDEKVRFEKQKQLELQNIEKEKKKFELEYKKLESSIQETLRQKEEELYKDRILLSQKQKELEDEMSSFISKERERLEAINQEKLDKEREHLKIQEELKHQELEREKATLIQEKFTIEKALKEQREEVAREKERLELVKIEQERMLKEKELEMNKKIDSQKMELIERQEREEAKIQEKIRLMKEEEEKIAKREELLRRQEEANRNLKHLSGDNKIITFLGCKPGVGTSTLAFNTAIALAEKKKKVLFLEIDDSFSTIGYIYKLNFYDIGIDVALKQMQTSNYENLSKNIISLKDVLDNTNKNDLMLYNYKKMPKDLDYMFYSGKYYSEKREDVDAYFKEFLMQLLTRYDYDYIVFDLNIKDIKYSDNDSVELDTISQCILQFSSKVYFTITQDISAVGSCIQTRKILMKAKMPVNEFKFILNRYESKSMLDKNGMEDWLKVKFDLVFPDKHKDCINSNYVGLPLILNCKDRDLHKAFNNVVQDILNSKTKKR